MARTRENRRGGQAIQVVGAARRSRSVLMVTTALQAVTAMVLAMPALAQPAPNARPAGGVVVGGSVTIGQTANNTIVNQTTSRGAVNWQSFDVGSKQSVTFQQPSAQAITLNTVVGPNPSQIAGRISANGQIAIVNQSGVTFFQGSQVNTAGLMVSASGTDPQAFMAGGKIAFDKPGNPNARVVNNGRITVREAGLASLVAPSVANNGVIDAKLGHVVLAGAKTATLDLYGDKMVSLNVSGAVTQAPEGGEALVTNTGVIRANGGTVRLTAKAVDGLVTNMVNAGGTIQARTVGSQTGTIRIDGVGGSITIGGTLDATGKAPGTTGGRIGLLATESVIVKSGAVVTASGAAGGGTVAVGTTFKRAAGGPAVTATRTAKRVIVEGGATITADATANGNGGNVTVLSTDLTTMAGTITAKGGAQGGNGGFVELSGKNLGVTGVVDVSAPHGTPGKILLDPDFLDIVSGVGTENGNFATNTGTVLAGDGKTATPDSIQASVINAFNGNVLLQANKTLTVASSVNLNAAAGLNLTLEAGGTIVVAAGQSVAATGDIILATGGAGPSSPPAAQASPLISILGTVASSGGSVSLLSGIGSGATFGTIAVGAAGVVSAPTSGKLITLQTDTLSVASGGKIQASSGIVEIAPATPANAITFTTSNATTLKVGTADLAGVSASVLRLGSVTVAGVPTATASSITFDTNVDLTGVATTLDLRATGGTGRTGSNIITVGTLTGSTTGADLVNGDLTDHKIGTVGSFAAGASVFRISISGAGTIAGPVTADSIFLGSTAGALNVTGTITGTTDLTVQTAGSIAAGSSSKFDAPTATFNSGAGGIAFNGGAIVGQTTGLVNLTSGGGIAQAATSKIQGATLQSPGGLGGTIDLLGTANAIGTIAAVTATGAKFTLVDTGSLVVSGALTAANIKIGADTIVAETTGKLTATTGLTLAANAGGITLKSSSVLNAPAVDLSATDGGVGQAGGGTIVATGSLISGSGIGGTGSVKLFGGTSNTIASVGSIAVTAGDFQLTANTGKVTTFGTISANNVTIASDTVAVGSSLLAIGGTKTVSLSSNAGGITLNSGHVVTGDILSISATGGGVSQTAAGAITVGTLLSPAVAGTIALTAGVNNIDTIGAVFATAGLAMKNSKALTLTGLIQAAAGNVFLSAPTLSLVAASTVKAATAGAVVGLQTDSLVGLSAASADATATGTFELAPLTSIGMTLGGAGGLSLVDLTGITAGTVRLGGLTQPSVLTTATAIAVAAAGFDAKAVNLDLRTSGAITQAAGGALKTTGTLSGVANIVTLTETTNVASKLGDFAATGTLQLTATGAVDVVGAATASGANLTTDAALTISGTVSAAAVALKGASIVIPGTVTDGGSGTVNLVSTATTIGETGTLVAGTLTGSAAGAVTLLGATAIVNKVATLGDFSSAGFTLNAGSALNVPGTVTSGAGDIVLKTDSTLTAGGSLTGNNVFLTGKAIALSGTVNATVTANFVSGPAGGISLNSGHVVLANVVDLTGDSGVTQNATGTISAATLISTGNVGGAPVSLLGVNSVGTVGGFSADAGFGLRNATGSLTVAGAVLSSGGAVFVSSPTVVFAAGGSLKQSGNGLVGIQANSIAELGVTGAKGVVDVGTGVFELAPIGANPLTLGAASGLSLTNTVGITAGTIRVGAITPFGSVSPTTVATGISVAGGFDAGATNVDLRTSGAITQGVGAALKTTGILAGVANTVTLTESTNVASKLGDFAATGTLQLAATGAVDVVGKASGSGVSLTTDNGLTISGTVSAAAVALKGASITIPGTVTDGGAGTVSLTATAGTIGETGTVIAGTLSGGSGRSATTLNGASATANQIATLGSFAAAGFSLRNGKNLTVSGTIAGGATIDLEAPVTGRLAVQLIDEDAVVSVGAVLAEFVAAEPMEEEA